MLRPAVDPARANAQLEMAPAAAAAPALRAWKARSPDVQARTFLPRELSVGIEVPDPYQRTHHPYACRLKEQAVAGWHGRLREAYA